jgi:hypothetical protein
MADPYGRPDPSGADPFEDRLRELARDTEPLVALAGPEAARRRGERRTSRQRAGAASLAAALALAIGCWQLLPHSGGSGRGSLPAATGTAPAGPSALRDALLPESALPGYPKYAWKPIPDADGAGFPDTCAVPSLHGLLGQASRTYYDAHDGLVARYRLYAFTDESTAAAQAHLVDARFTAKCAPGGAAAGDGRAPQGRIGYHGLSDPKRATRTWMDRQGVYLAILSLTGTGNPAAPYSDYGSTDSWPELCITRSLDRLDTGTPPDQDATTTPSTPSAPATTGTGGTGSGTAAGPGAGPDENRTETPTTTTKRC